MCLGVLEPILGQVGRFVIAWGLIQQNSRSMCPRLSALPQNALRGSFCVVFAFEAPL